MASGAQVVTDLVATSDVWWRSPYLLQREASVAAEVVLSSALADLPAITAWIVSLSPWRLGEHEPLRLEGFAWDELAGQGATGRSARRPSVRVKGSGGHGVPAVLCGWLSLPWPPRPAQLPGLPGGCRGGHRRGPTACLCPVRPAGLEGPGG